MTPQQYNASRAQARDALKQARDLSRRLAVLRGATQRDWTTNGPSPAWRVFETRVMQIQRKPDAPVHRPSFRSVEVISATGFNRMAGPSWATRNPMHQCTDALVHRPGLKAIADAIGVAVAMWIAPRSIRLTDPPIERIADRASSSYSKLRRQPHGQGPYMAPPRLKAPIPR